MKHEVKCRGCGKVIGGTWDWPGDGPGMLEAHSEADCLASKLDEHRKHIQVQLKRAEDAEEELATHLNVHLGVVADNQDLRKRLRDAESRLDTATRLLSVAIKEWAGWMDDARGMEPVDPEYAEAKAFLLRNKADVERGSIKCGEFSPGNGLPCLRDQNHGAPHRDTLNKEW